MLRDRIATADEVAEPLAAHAAELHSLAVKSLYLFGSIARGDARPDSDLVMAAGLHPRLRKRVLCEAQRVA
jgi:predicted nucleotidyltransferase